MKLQLPKSLRRLVINAFTGMFSISSAAFAATPSTVVTLPAHVTVAEIQHALDTLPAEGGEVVLLPGKIELAQPIVLDRDGQALRGAGDATILFVSDNANCPAIIMGQPVN